MDWSQLLLSSFQRAPWGWGLLAMGMVTLVRVWPLIKKLTIGEHEQMRQEYVDQIKALRKEVDELRNRVDGLVSENTELKLQIVGMGKQHLAEQAAAIRNVPAVRDAVREVAKDERRGKA